MNFGGSENPIWRWLSAAWNNKQLFTNETACRPFVEVIEHWQTVLADYIANGVDSQ